MSDRYEIRDEIGKGGLGAVYKAFDTQLHREVAMKRVLTTEHATEEEVRAAADNLIAEAKTLSSLNHPNIVTVFDVGQDEKGGFVVMELLKGETLDETVERGVLTQDDFIEVVTQTMEALVQMASFPAPHHHRRSGAGNAGNPLRHSAKQTSPTTLGATRSAGSPARNCTSTRTASTRHCRNSPAIKVRPTPLAGVG
jgi:serine/threonine protein kinase